MIFLPKGNPVREKVNPGKINIPDAFVKLQQSDFSGYLRFNDPLGAGWVIFRNGRLADAFFESDGLPGLRAADALKRIFNQAVRGTSSLDIYKISAELAGAVHALLKGRSVFSAHELARVDVKKLLLKIKNEGLSCCLRGRAGDRVVLIFYRQGEALGFFHEGSAQMDTTAVNTRSVARYQGATLEVFSCVFDEPSGAVDLVSTLEVSSLWEEAKAGLREEQRRNEDLAVRVIDAKRVFGRDAVLEYLQQTAEDFIGKIGLSLVDKTFRNTVAVGREFEAVDQRRFFEALGKAARLVAGPKKIDAMLEEMRKGLESLKGSA